LVITVLAINGDQQVIADGEKKGLPTWAFAKSAGLLATSRDDRI
jgi:hypothetical protein